MTSDVEKVYKSKVPRAPVKAQYSRSRAPHPHLTCYSPFRVRDAIRDMHPLPPIAVQESREREYVVDAVKSDVFFNSPYHRPRRMSIIKPYDAMNDRHSAGYFRSPIVKQFVTRTLSAQQPRQMPAEKRGLHRMSARCRSVPTPPPSTLESKEKNFILDNVRSERLRNKQNPIIPEYDASLDRYSRRYFQRRLVQNVLRKTVTTPLRLYPTITFYAPSKNDIVV
ncbi:uncharacterized protein LOC143450019 [Clavelina lepadiformis]|uniref:uncharacterized protein LOC143450019 n=1 Tax=Clavelina lepadiformis TaxID=159417 RepID=UPI00404225F9